MSNCTPYLSSQLLHLSEWLGGQLLLPLHPLPPVLPVPPPLTSPHPRGGGGGHHGGVWGELDMTSLEPSLFTVNAHQLAKKDPM